jgi:hypothetical protein
MKRKMIVSSVGLGIIALTSMNFAVAETCSAGTATSVSGKITNNAVGPGTTLGVVHLNVGGDKMKCGIVGNGTTSMDGQINFVHNVVCDDSIEVYNPNIGMTENLHSQITLNTTGFITEFAACSSDGNPAFGARFSFVESSTPIPGSGRGIFNNVSEGMLNIKGTANCQLAIDMKFGGYVCLQ